MRSWEKPPTKAQLKWLDQQVDEAHKLRDVTLRELGDCYLAYKKSAKQRIAEAEVLAAADRWEKVSAANDALVEKTQGHTDGVSEEGELQELARKVRALRKVKNAENRRSKRSNSRRR